jgi:hypothetical protein
MATQTRTARQAAGNKAAATRKRNAATRSARSTKTSAKQTTNAARSTPRGVRSAAKQASRTADRRADAATSGLQVLARQAERAVLIPVGAVLEARDAAVSTVRTYSDRGTAKRELDRFERRGESALRRNRRRLEQQVKEARRDVGKRTNGLSSRAEGAVEEIRRLV